jgi:hypothetical protein
MANFGETNKNLLGKDKLQNIWKYVIGGDKIVNDRIFIKDS